MNLKLILASAAFVVGAAGTVAAQSAGGTQGNAPASPPAAKIETASGDAAHGKELFMKDGCYECHGYVGQGAVGARLAPAPLPWEGIAAYIRNPAGEMPPYVSKVVSDQDVRDIHAYLATIPTPPRVADIPLLKP